MSEAPVLIVVGIGWSLLMLVASAFFSGAETALVSLSPQKAKQLALKNPKLSNDLLAWIGQPHELLTLILIGNTFATILFATAVSGLAIQVATTYSPTLLKWLTWGLETVLIVLFADMGPKFFARSNPEKTSLMVLPWLSRLRILFRPILSLFDLLIAFFPKLKTPPVGQVLTFSMQELRSLLEEGHPSGEVTGESVNMMQRVLEINHRKTEEIMTPLDRIDFVDLDPKKGRPEPDRDLLLDLIVENGHTRTPVCQGGKFVGFIHSDDLMPLILKDRRQKLTTLIRKPMVVSPDRLVANLLQDFRSSGIYVAFVNNANGDMVGLVTLEDVLEEITGEILDEYDVSEPK